MEQSTESPLTPLGQQLLSEFPELRDQRSTLQLQTSPSWLYLLILIVPFFLVDLSWGSIGALNGQLANEGGLLFFCVSMILATFIGSIPVQAVLLSCYAVFSPDSGWLRFFIWLGATGLLSITGLFGVYLGFLSEDSYVGDHEMENAVRYFCAMPTIAIAAQFPLWILRGFGGWQFLRLGDEQDPTAQPRRPLSITHLLVATTGVAVALGCLRIAPLQTLGNQSDYWLAFAVFAGIAAGASLLGGWLNWIFTRVQNQFYVWSLAIGLPLNIGVIVFSWMVWGMSWEQIYDEPLFLFSVFSMMGLSFIFGIAGSVRLLQIFRWEIGAVRSNPHH